MTQDEIIEITKHSGLNMLLEIGGMYKCLEHFAKLVAEKEREACAVIADEWVRAYPHPSQIIAERIREREKA